MLSFLYSWRESIINMDDKRCNWDLKKKKRFNWYKKNLGCGFVTGHVLNVFIFR